MLRKDPDIFVVSDLHLGDGGPTDNFADCNRHKEFLSFLEYVRSQEGKLIILGDLFEFWQSNFGAVIIKNLDLLHAISQLDCTYVIGNHDADLMAFVGKKFLGHHFFDRMSGPFDMQIGLKKFHFMHGHEIDSFNASGDPSWGRMLAILAAIFERNNGSPLWKGKTVEDRLNSSGEWTLRTLNWLIGKLKLSCSPISVQAHLTPVQKPSVAQELLQRYCQYKTDNAYDVLVTGHTHKPGRIGDWYYNSGSWSENSNNYIRISPWGEVMVWDWKNGQSLLNQTVLG